VVERVLQPGHDILGAKAFSAAALQGILGFIEQATLRMTDGYGEYEKSGERNKLFEHWRLFFHQRPAPPFIACLDFD
jgi:hypothetical protein